MRAQGLLFCLICVASMSGCSGNAAETPTPDPAPGRPAPTVIEPSILPAPSPPPPTIEPSPSPPPSTPPSTGALVPIPEIAPVAPGAEVHVDRELHPLSPDTPCVEMVTACDSTGACTGSPVYIDCGRVTRVGRENLRCNCP